MRFLRNLVLSFLVCSCIGNNTWHGDRTFTPEERANIEYSNRFMARHIGVEPYDIVWDADHQWPNNPCPEPHQILKNTKAVVDGGLYTHNPPCIYLNGRASSFNAPAAHEFGHSYGLPHLDEHTAGVMNPWVSPLIWTDADQKNCERVLVCRP